MFSITIMKKFSLKPSFDVHFTGSAASGNLTFFSLKFWKKVRGDLNRRNF